MIQQVHHGVDDQVKATGIENQAQMLTFTSFLLAGMGDEARAKADLTKASELDPRLGEEPLPTP
ncbi:hypothetical protein AYO44_11140 [Planctomycetaceae bacterium SCGC AG-212-F19]|nr:hypothetical protein AYO44_11140 [Planctomycetaceae bacterium SCGC AG-212-F19]